MKKNNPIEIITHHSNGTVYNACASTQHHTVEIIDDSHADRWSGFTSQVYKRADGRYYHVGYHFVIFKENGKWQWEQTRSINEEGAHCIGKNTSSIGVCIVGNYDACAGDNIEQGALECWQEVYHDIQTKMLALFGREIMYKDINPHRKYASKSCHGNTLADDYYAKQAMTSETPPALKRIKDLEEQISMRDKIIKSLSDLVVYLINRSTSKRLSLREVNHKTS